ncbi:uncharacterized protein METZ01_LOCUS276513 [marine metagenome]|uniref:Fe2OG dioxygenase domain-containing protein n=1 Tax=marine metagenome TaxID=408172 RepID=A0A382KHF5_9ZZZZ
MNKNIEHYVFRKENFLDEKYCDNCINELKKGDWKKHSFYNPISDSLYAPSGDNESEIMENDFNPKNKNIKKINDFIVQNLHSVILEYIESFNFDWFTAWSGFTALKFIRYHPGQEMVTHCDHIHHIFDGIRKGIPIFSIIGILNDDYEGGELIMFEDKKIDTKKGDLLIFPSNFLYPHEIIPVTRGVRYSYVSWVW